MIFRGPAGLGLLICLGFLVAANPAFAQKGRKIEFNRDIRPILSENCFVCHGPDNNLRKAKLRLDQEENVYKDRDGYKILAPGDPQKSELFLRIATKGRDRMPPKRTNKSLTPKEVALIKEWIAQGGKYQGHWSFIPPKQAKVPKVKLQALVRNPIDNFILAELE